jgi:hypothetical protein
MIDAEDAARANFYGLIARLFYAAPDPQLISQLLQARRSKGETELRDGGANDRGLPHAFPALEPSTRSFRRHGKAR